MKRRSALITTLIMVLVVGLPAVNTAKAGPSQLVARPSSGTQRLRGLFVTIENNTQDYINCSSSEPSSPSFCSLQNAFAKANRAMDSHRMTMGIWSCRFIDDKVDVTIGVSPNQPDSAPIVYASNGWSVVGCIREPGAEPWMERVPGLFNFPKNETEWHNTSTALGTVFAGHPAADFAWLNEAGELFLHN